MKIEGFAGGQLQKGGKTKQQYWQKLWEICLFQNARKEEELKKLKKEIAELKANQRKNKW